LTVVYAQPKKSPTIEEAAILLQQGNAEHSRKEYTAAIQTWKKAAPIYLSLNKFGDYIDIFANIGIAFENQKRYSDALRYYRQSIDLSKKFELSGRLRTAYGNAGDACYHLEAYRSAAEYYKLSIDVAQSIGDTNRTNAERYYPIATRKINKTAADLAPFLDPLKNPGSLEKRLLIQYLDTVATSLFSVGEFGSALRFYNELYRTYMEIGNRDEAVSTIAKIAQCYDRMKNIDAPAEHTESGPTESITARFRTLEIVTGTADSSMVILDAGKADGLFEGSKGEAVSVWRKGRNVQSGTSLGKVEILTVGDNFSTARVIITNPRDTVIRLEEGDMIIATVRIPKRAYRSLLYEMAILNIDFLNADSEPMIHFRQVMSTDSDTLEAFELEAMAGDVRRTAGWLEDRIKQKEFASLTTPLQNGRYSGLSVYDVMKAATSVDIRSFLRFVKAYPGKYMGSKWKINETFATWILNEAPIANDDLLEILLSAANEIELDKVLTQYSKSIIEEQFVADWGDLARTESEKGNYPKARSIINICYKAAAKLNDSTSTASALYYDAGVSREERNYDQAILLYLKARDFYKKLDNQRVVGLCLINIGGIYNDQDKYEKALTVFQELLALRTKAAEKEKTISVKDALAAAYWRIGNTLYYISRYSEALKNYEQSLKLYEGINTLSSIKNIGYVQTKVGDSYEKLSDYNKAIDANRIALTLYRQVADEQGAATALFNIGYDHFKQSLYREAIDYYEQAYALNIALERYKSASLCKSNVGQAYWNTGEYQKAIDAHNEALRLRKLSSDLQGQAYSWNKLGGVYKESGDPRNAIVAYDSSLTLYIAVKDTSGVASTNQNLGELYQSVKEYQKAIEHYEHALGIRKSINAQYDAAASLYSIGDAYYEDSKYSKARPYFEESLKLRRSIGDKTGQLNCLSKLAAIFQYSEINYEKAEKLHYEALKLARSTDSKSDIGYCYFNLARLYSAKGNFDKSAALLDSALKIFRAIEYKASESMVLAEIGSTYITRGEFNKGLEYYNRSLAVAESCNSRSQIASVYNSIGDVYSVLGDLNKAIEIQNKSYTLNIELQNPWGIASSHIGLGNCYNRFGEYQQAIDHYLVADSIYNSLNNDLARATPLNNIGTIYFWQADYARALTYFQQAYELLSRIKYESDFFALLKSNIGEIYLYQKNYKEAERWLNESLPLSRKMKARRLISEALSIFGQLYLETNNLPKAKAVLLEAYSISKETGELTSRVAIAAKLGALYYKMKDEGNAIKYLEESISISRSTGSVKHLWEPLYTLGLIYRDRNEVQRSLKYLKDAVEAMETLRNRVVGGEQAQRMFSSGDIQTRLYDAITSVLLKMGDTDGALQYLNRSYNDGLKQQFGKMNIRFNDETKNQALTFEKDLKRRVDGVDEQIAKEKAKPQNQQNTDKIKSLEQTKAVAEGDYIKFVNQTIKEQPELANYFRKSVNVLDMRKLKREMPKDLAVVAYLMGERQLYIFTTTSDTVVAKIVAIKKADLDGMVSRMYKFVRNASLSARAGNVNVRTLQPEKSDAAFEYTTQIVPFKELSENLYSYLISPIAKQIEGKKYLAIVPNGSLYYVPFQTLGRAMPDSTFRWLISDYSIFYSTTLNLFYTKGEDRQEMKLIAFGNPDKTLPNASLEVNSIHDLYPTSAVYLGDDATKEKAKTLPQHYTAIHFATHGNLDYADFQKSYLTLAPDKSTGDDGKLTLEEVWQMNLEQTNLVTLSACQTAVGDEMIQGWLNNPADAFLQLGVKTVVASLWQVDDAATGKLMKEFYTNMKTSNKVDALRNAQLTLLNDSRYAFPYFWAPFILVGDWR
jgi:tetratricopeptide (TPR) repeat protein